MNVTRLSDFEISQIMDIINLAKEFENGNKVDYQGKKIVANLFFEPSTRTHYSFETAALRLGCKTMNLETSNSSLLKGETLYDTVKTFDSFNVDAFVIRSSRNEYFNELIGKIKAPILNGGDGTGNHPSQSLLDLYTIYQEFGYFKGLKCVIVGDIKHSRVAHTNYEVMRRLGMEVYTSGPIECKEDDLNYVEFDKIIDQVDIVMLLRVQRERHETLSNLKMEEYHRQYGLSKARYAKMKSNAIIMHPAPFIRNEEIDSELVECKQSRIYKQMENGVYIRMALLNMVLGHE